MAQKAAMMSLFLFTVLASVDAHSHPMHPMKSQEDCTCEPGAKPFESYHIHVLFYEDGIEQFENNTHNSKFARALRKRFIEHFKIGECSKKDIFNLTTLCAFEVDATGAGGVANAAPFVTPNFAIFVPVDRYAEAVPWMMANRGDLDFLVHPNSCGFSCSPQDHLLWSVWGGNKWPVRFQLPEPISAAPSERKTATVTI